MVYVHTYSINHPQLKWYMRVTGMCKSKKHAWHQTKHVHACKINAPQTCTYRYEISAMKRSTLQTSSALSFTIYACRTILGGIVTNILGHPRHTAFLAPCS